MSEETNVNSNEQTFTQEQVNAIVADRLAREKGKYSDYEELKEAAAKYAELEEASKSELQKAIESAEKSNARVAELEKQIADKQAEDERNKLVNKIAKKYRVPSDMKRFLRGVTEEELAEEAELLGERFAQPSSNEGQKPANIEPASDEMSSFLETLKNQYSPYFGK